MLFPIIKVKDELTGNDHIVGTESHDMLIIQGGSIQYLNLKDSGSSGCGDYKFIGSTVEFVTFEELQKIYDEQSKIKKSQNKIVQECLKEKMELIMKVNE